MKIAQKKHNLIKEILLSVILEPAWDITPTGKTTTPTVLAEILLSVILEPAWDITPTGKTTTPTVLAIHDTSAMNLAHPRFQGIINVESDTPEMKPIRPNQRLRDNSTLPRENRINDYDTSTDSNTKRILLID